MRACHILQPALRASARRQCRSLSFKVVSELSDADAASIREVVRAAHAALLTGDPRARAHFAADAVCEVAGRGAAAPAWRAGPAELGRLARALGGGSASARDDDYPDFCDPAGGGGAVRVRIEEPLRVTTVRPSGTPSRVSVASRARAGAFACEAADTLARDAATDAWLIAHRVITETAPS